MAINTIEAAKIFQTALDQQVLEEATTGWMEDNAGQVKYSGGAVAMIPKVSMSGLGNYDRNSGYTQGAISLTYEAKTMTMDRDSKFLLDKMDVDETNFPVLAANQTAKSLKVIETSALDEVDEGRTTGIYITQLQFIYKERIR